MIQYEKIISISLFTSSCNGQINKETDKQSTEKLVTEKIEPYKYGAGDVVNRGYLDKSGNMWFTTLKEGVFKYDGKMFKNFTVKDGLCSNIVNAVVEDKNGIMWFGTAKGLCSYDGENFINIPLPQEDIQSVSSETGLPSRKTETVLSLIQASNGASDYGNKFGEPIILGFTRSFKNKDYEKLKQQFKKEIIIVFGCGGERDPGKRPLMGRVAAELADHVFVTDDNPRGEDPSSIRSAILTICKNSSEIGDREEAISRAIGWLDHDDTLLIAGKGHETSQIVGCRTIKFDDIQVVRGILGIQGPR